MSLEDVVVLDAGSSSFKAGLGANIPSDTEPSIVTRSAVRDTSEPAGSSGRGREFAAVSRGRIIDWDAYEAILDDILYSKLGWQIGEEGALLAGESLFTSRAEREKLTQLVFEHNNVAGFFLCDQPLLSLYAVGKLSGCVVDLGHNKIDVSTVLDGQLLAPSASRIDFGLNSVLAELAKLLQARGCPIQDLDALGVLRNAVLRIAESADEANKLLSKGEQVESEEHILPDGQRISVGSEGIQLGELLLDPPTSARETPSLVDSIVNSCTTHTETAIRKTFFENLLVCGGGSAVQGLPARLLKDLQLKMQPNTMIATLSSPEYLPQSTLQRSVWMGGAVLSKWGVGLMKQQLIEVLDEFVVEVEPIGDLSTESARVKAGL